jgi:release factor glutamine methyltransferase
VATIGDLLASGTTRLRASGSESARLDAELLLGRAVGAARTSVLAHPEAPVGADAAATYEAGIVRREAGEPVAYIRGLKEFHGLAFGVDRRALIPRPETELLVSEAEREIAWRLTSAPRPAGTPQVRVIDVGPDALDLARENAVAHSAADAIAFEEADLVPAAESPFDVILANLPYIPSAEIDRLPVAASFEPRLALDGGPDGLAVVRRLLVELPWALAPDGVALLEIGFDQGPALGEAVAALEGEWSCRIQPDISGNPRLAHVERSTGWEARG